MNPICIVYFITIQMNLSNYFKYVHIIVASTEESFVTCILSWRLGLCRKQGI